MQIESIQIYYQVMPSATSHSHLKSGTGRANVAMLVVLYADMGIKI